MEAIIKRRKRGCLTTLSDLPPLRNLLNCRSTFFLTPTNVTIQGRRMYQHGPFMFNVTYQDVCLGSTVDPSFPEDRKFARCNTKESKEKKINERISFCLSLYTCTKIHIYVIKPILLISWQSPHASYSVLLTNYCSPTMTTMTLVGKGENSSLENANHFFFHHFQSLNLEKH